jgi:clan AA aspartic protease
VGFTHLRVSLKAPGGSADRYDANFLIDTGALDPMAPASALRKVGIEPIGRLTYELADGSQHDFEFGLAEMEVMGTITAGRVLFGPEGVEPLLGVLALESVGVTIDPLTQTLTKHRVLRLKLSLNRPSIASATSRP